MILCFVPICCTYGQLKMATPFPVQVYKGNNVTSIVYEIHLVDSLKRPVEFLDFTISSEKKIGNYILLGTTSKIIQKSF